MGFSSAAAFSKGLWFTTVSPHNDDIMVAIQVKMCLLTSKFGLSAILIFTQRWNNWSSNHLKEILDENHNTHFALGPLSSN